MFVNNGIESGLYMKDLRNAVCTCIAVIMTLTTLCCHVPTVSQVPWRVLAILYAF